MIWKTLGFQATAIAAVVAAIVFLVPLSGQQASNPGTTATSVREPGSTALPSASSAPVEDTQPDGGAGTTPYGNIQPEWSPGPEHDAHENAEHHWQKHGSEFSELHSERDYTNAAHDFVNHPPPGAEIKHDGRGNTLIYDPDSNTFAVQAPNGAPRTMFRPRSGRTYWDRQR